MKRLDDGFPVDSKYYYLKVKGDLNKVRESRSSKGSQDYMDCNFATLMGTMLATVYCLLQHFRKREGKASMTSITEEMAHPFDHIECQHLEGHVHQGRPTFETSLLS